jgi:hypothetical protein
MPKYQFIVHRTIGEQYKFYIEADNEAEASDNADELLMSGDLSMDHSNLVHDCITEEFITEIKEIK